MAVSVINGFVVSIIDKTLAIRAYPFVFQKRSQCRD